MMKTDKVVILSFVLLIRLSHVLFIRAEDNDLRYHSSEHHHNPDNDITPSSSLSSVNPFHPDAEDHGDDRMPLVPPAVHPVEKSSSGQKIKLQTEEDLDLDMRVEDFIDDTLRLVGSSGHVLKEQLAPFKDSHQKTLQQFPHYNSRNSDHHHPHHFDDPSTGSSSGSHGSSSGHHDDNSYQPKGTSGSSDGKSNRHQSSSSSSSGAFMTSNINVNSTGIWLGYGNALRKITDTFIRQSLPRILDASYSTNVSADCAAAFIQIFTGLRHEAKWVMRMFDSMARPIPAGISDGTLTDFGSYDQCLSIRGPDTMRGQYCLMKWAPPLPPKPEGITFQTRVLDFQNTTLDDTFLDDLAGYAHALYDRYGRYGICSPSACSKFDLQQVIDSIFDGSHFLMEISYCEVQTTDYNFRMDQKVIIAAIFLIIFMVSMATTIEIITLYTREKDYSLDYWFLEFLFCFSIHSNGQQLLSTSTSPDSISCIHGIRVISMTWLLLTHTYLIPLKETFAFARHFLYVVEDVVFQLILNGWVLVDTFFCIGAMLATLSLLNSMKKNHGLINIPQIIFHRICRLTPNMWFTVALMFVIPSLGSGPLWPEYFDYQEGKCRNYWWATTFYFNNWLPESKLCLLHTWYLSADFQMFVLTSCLFIIPLYWKPAFGSLLILLTIITSILGNGLNTFYRKLPPTVIYNTPSESDVYAEAAQVYLPTYVHLGPYCVGILLGFILHHHKSKRLSPISLWLNFILWFIAISVAGCILLATLDWNRGIRWSPMSSGLYAGLHRTCWSLVVAWITYACATGNGGPVNTFLSWKLFVPLSRVSYMVYLMHFLVLWIRYASIRWTLPFSHYTMFCEFIINLVLSTIIAAAGYLLIEAPVGRLTKLYFDGCFSFAAIRIKKHDESRNYHSSTQSENDQTEIKENEENGIHVTNLILNGFTSPAITRL